MSLPSSKKQPKDVIDSILKRAKVAKMARQLKDRLALAQFKAQHGWEDLPFETIEPRVQEEIKRKRMLDGDFISDTSSTASDPPYPTRALMSSPLKPPIFSDAVGSSNGSSGHRKRSWTSYTNHPASSPSKRFCASPTAHRPLSNHATWKGLTQSSPTKPRRMAHFTTSDGPDVSFSQNRRIMDDEESSGLHLHSFPVKKRHASPPRTPPMQTRHLSAFPRIDNANPPGGVKSGEEGADLLLFLASSPSSFADKGTRGRMEGPVTPTPKGTSKLDLPSSMMNTPGGSNPFLNTPGPGYEISDFIHATPSPNQKAWRTPTHARTPLSVNRRRLTFEEPLL
ncbi:hypothetical protein CDD82_2260 [Ophiocordyceps australis]|uniref:Uncharacterized protein n=1 Tax=Ophiocordyceps australis TaxID=1399860 RepID=A0A2C5Y131_9HYPO|nr:hypothetical protein CDD82_2260 [Ophiocordyceps australis]